MAVHVSLRPGNEAPGWVILGSREMSQIDDIKTGAAEIAAGLRKLGPDRVVALSVHVTKELVAELEQKAKKLVQQLEALDG